MPISGTGTGPFTVTGTVTVEDIYDHVVAANAANASKAGASYTFNCEVGWDGSTTPVVIQTPSPTAEDVAAAVRTELAVELGRLDAAVSTRLAASGYTAPPSADTNATAVRAELATELARLDVPVGSRLSTTTYDAPDNASIATILTNTARRAPSSGRAVTE